jgi:hypothetical protein
MILPVQEINDWGDKLVSPVIYYVGMNVRIFIGLPREVNGRAIIVAG